MPYLHHTNEFIKNTTEMWKYLIALRDNGKKKYTQIEIIASINEEYGKVSIKTIKCWCKGEYLDRGQGVGQPRGNYMPQGKMPQRRRKNATTTK